MKFQVSTSPHAHAKFVGSLHHFWIKVKIIWKFNGSTSQHNPE
jgi:hypothetical protein